LAFAFPDNDFVAPHGVIAEPVLMLAMHLGVIAGVHDPPPLRANLIAGELANDVPSEKCGDWREAGVRIGRNRAEGHIFRIQWHSAVPV
jgi:hypothetical protein